MGWGELSSLILNGSITCISSLNVSQTTRLNRATTLLSSLNVSGTTRLKSATT
jgi:hypothetical protein